jgi:hypothetical protein
MIKKSGLLFSVLNKIAHLKMLPEFYLNCLKSQLSASQLLTLEMLVWLLQFHKQVRIERLAACLPLPVLYESRRRHVQRFLILPQLSIPLLWFPLIKCILLTKIPPGNRVIVALDRTQWKQNNLFVVSVIWDKRAWPIYWLIALAYTCAGLQGQFLKLSGQQKYVSRLKELNRMTRRHSNFWVGLYGQMWIAALEACSDWVRDLIRLRANKREFFQKGLRAMNLIQAAL